MFFGFSTLTYDELGDLVLDADLKATNPFIFEKREVKTATLDGNSQITRLGNVTGADNVRQIKVMKITAGQIEQIMRLIELYDEVMMSCAEGVFLGTLNKLKYDRLPVSFEFSITQRIV